MIKDPRIRRRSRQRYKMRNSGRPRLCVNRTNKNTYAQIIDDLNHVTLASASTLSKEFVESSKNGGNKDAAAYVGKIIAEKALKIGIQAVVFDRSGFLYHGRVKEIADNARKFGLVF